MDTMGNATDIRTAPTACGGTSDIDVPTLCANCEDCGAPILIEYSHCDRCARGAGENDCNCGLWYEDRCPMHGFVPSVEG